MLPVVKEETQYENNVRHTLDIVLASNEKCSNRIKKFLTGVPDIKKAERLIEKGLTYNASVKRQLSDSETNLEFPEKLPVGIKRPPTTPQLADEIAFVKIFKENAGRMNWTQSLTKTHGSARKSPLITLFNWIQSSRQFQYTYQTIVTQSVNKKNNNRCY